MAAGKSRFRSYLWMIPVVIVATAVAMAVVLAINSLAPLPAATDR